MSEYGKVLQSVSVGLPSEVDRGDRRLNRRYQLELPVRYLVQAESRAMVSGSGATRSLSSRSVTFVADREFPVGSSAELWVSWPAAAAEIERIELRLSGHVIRSGSVANEVVVKVQRHRFLVSRRAVAVSSGSK